MLKKRNDIDGLRAIAVIPVVMFHAGINIFPGGFVGVDIFFVISGFLITHLIIQEINKNNFSIGSFYLRRMRRILPALIFLIFSCIIIFWWFMSPTQYESLMQSIISSLFFYSNFFFWKSTGYFQIAAEELPLLHTWSLSVEEQYYLFFPFLILVLKKYIWKFFTSILIFFTASSLLLCIWGATEYPSANFYLSFTRAWEILFGSLCALILIRCPLKKNNFFSIFGLLLIFYSFLFFDYDSNLPSFLTMIPVLGTCLIIIFSEENNLCGKFLSLKLLTFIGLMSYSLYLWHQPILAFGKITNNLNYSNVHYFIILSFIIGYFSWRFVENPFRERKGDLLFKISDKHVIYFSFISIFSLTLFSFSNNYFNLHDKNYQYRIKNSENKSLITIHELIKKNNSYDPNNYFVNKDCHFIIEFDKKSQNRFDRCSKKHGKATILYGDSHTINLFQLLHFSNYSKFVVVYWARGKRNEMLNNKVHEKFWKFVKNKNQEISIVVFHIAGSYLLRDFQGTTHSQDIFNNKRNFSINYEDIERYTLKLKNLSKLVKVAWLGPFTEARVKLDNVLNLGNDNLKIDQYTIDVFKILDESLSSYIKSKSFELKYISLQNKLNISTDDLLKNDCITFRDYDHFSYCGEQIFSKRIKSLSLK